MNADGGDAGGDGSGDPDDGYVHDPATFDDDGGESEQADDGGYVHDPATFDDDGGDPFASEDVPTVDRDGLGRRGWVLLATVVLAFFGAPAVIYLRPPGVPFEVALLVVPLVPAFALGTIAVWALAGRTGE